MHTTAGPVFGAPDPAAPDERRTLAVWPADRCPLLARYQVVRFLSSGAYGVVALVRERALQPPGPGETDEQEWVVKLQRLDDQRAGEITVEKAIHVLLEQWRVAHPRALVHVVRFYDWTQCQLAPADILAPLGLADEVRAYDAMVTERLADSLWSVLRTYEPVLAESSLTFQHDYYAALLVQVVAQLVLLLTLSSGTFEHNDLRTPNVLVRRVPYEQPRNQFLVYHLPGAPAPLSVPLAWCHYSVLALTDFGRSSVSFTPDVATAPAADRRRQTLESPQTSSAKASAAVTLRTAPPESTAFASALGYTNDLAVFLDWLVSENVPFRASPLFGALRFALFIANTRGPMGAAMLTSLLYTDGFFSRLWGVPLPPDELATVVTLEPFGNAAPTVEITSAISRVPSAPGCR